MAETITAPIDDKIKFVSEEEAEKFDKMMHKDYVRLVNGKPHKPKEFIYRIIGSHPYEPAGAICAVGKFLIMFEVQKFYRKKFVTKNTSLGGELKPEKVNEKVDGHLWDTQFGVWKLVDEDANRHVDARKFLEEYQVDSDTE
jgi:hypothetical protein